MATAVTFVPSGGVPAVAVSAQGAPVTPVSAGGLPMTLVSSGGTPVTVITEAGVAYAPETANVLSAMTVQPTVARMALIDTLITALKSAGIWTQLDAFWVLAAHDSQAACLNWIDPTRFTCLEVASPIFTADRGYAGNGTTSYLNAQFVPSTNGVKYTQNSASVIAWSRTAGQIATPILGSATQNNCRIIPRNASDNAIFTVNNTTQVTRANTDGSGLFVASRTGASTQQLYRNGAALGAADTGASTTVPTSALNLLRSGTTLFSSAQIAVAGIASGLDATQNANLYTSLNTYLTAIGAN